MSLNALWAEQAALAIDSGQVVSGRIPSVELLKQVQQFVQLNRDVLLDYWHYRIDTAQLQKRLRAVTDVP
jgi:hypothetical protein